jgi:DNA-3-methyladenine glycosylase I
MTSPRAARAPKRCAWAGFTDPLYHAYHDTEWGVPCLDDRALFEKLVLEGAQAGLSWITVLRKREAYRRAYRGFDPRRVARFGAADVKRLLADAGLVRNRLKIESSITNARAVLEVQRRYGSFAAFVWSFVGGKPIVNAPHALADLPARTPESEALSAALRAHGFRFVGPTIVYAWMQSMGLVNDHQVGCFRRAASVRESRRTVAPAPRVPVESPRRARRAAR